MPPEADNEELEDNKHQLDAMLRMAMLALADTPT